MSVILYHNPISTCSQKARLALAEKGLGYESRVIDWGKREHLSDWYLAINPHGVVPSLVHDGRPIIDSSVICEYLDEAFGERTISPADPAERATMRSWMRYFEEVPTPAVRVPSYNMLFIKALRALGEKGFQDLTEQLPLRKHFYRRMGEHGFSKELLAESLESLGKCLHRVDRALGDGRTYLLGDELSVADIVLIPSVVRMEDLGLAHMWEQLPHFQRWYRAVQQRPPFGAAYYEGCRVDPATYALKIQS